jgi:DNA-binding LacI/PurR family transcriptional regulator
VADRDVVVERRRTVPTINDVARRAGVSKGLVSFVVNKRPGVAAATRARILRVAEELNWRPSIKARTLSTRTTYALGLVIRRSPEIVAADPFFPAFMAGVESVLARQGRVLVFSVVPDAASEERAYRALVTDNRVDGVFLTDLRRHDPRVRMLEQLGLPAVLVGCLDQTVGLPSVNLDDTIGVASAVQHLIDLGHTRIAYVAGDQQYLHARRRRAAFARTVRAAGLDGLCVMCTDFTMAAGAAATRALLDRAQPPTAIVYANDPLAIAGLGVLQSRRIDIPGQISIIGYDGTEMVRHTHPALTTIVADAELWGATAATTLLRFVAEGQADNVWLPAAQLTHGDSVAPPPFSSTSD